MVDTGSNHRSYYMSLSVTYSLPQNSAKFMPPCLRKLPNKTKERKRKLSSLDRAYSMLHPI